MAEEAKEGEVKKTEEEGKAVTVRKGGTGKGLTLFDEMDRWMDQMNRSFEQLLPHRWGWGRMRSPFEEMDRMRYQMDRLMENFSPRGWLRSTAWDWSGPFGGRAPRVDVIDRDEELVVEAELPGVAKDDLDVSMTDESVTIKATTSREEKEEERGYYRSEMSRGAFSRTVPLPVEVDSSKAKATFKDGVMRLVLPKVEPTKRRRIKVE